MLKQPIFRAYPQKVSRQTVAFAGLNYGASPAEGELTDSTGLCAQACPVLSQRPPRRTVHTCAAEPTALFAWNRLVEVEGEGLYYDGVFQCSVLPGDKQFAVVANKLVVWPDMVVLDLENRETRDYSRSLTSLEGADVTFTVNSVTIQTNPWISTETSQRYGTSASTWQGARRPFWKFMLYGGGDVTVQSGREIRVGDRLQVHCNASGGYSLITGAVSADGHNTPIGECGPLPAAPDVWAEVTKTTWTQHDEDSATYEIYYRVVDGTTRSERFSDYFRVGDRVKLSGAGAGDRSGLAVAAVADTRLTFDLPAGQELTPRTVSGQITLSHDIPALDFICAKDNRLWGFSNATQTIHASALGKPMEFLDYSDLSTGSYYAEVGSAGDATGMAAYGGAVLVFKENALYKVLGGYPAEYRYTSYSVSGVQPGSHLSLATINETLYFLGREGVYAYTGDLPQLVSAKLGGRRFANGRAGTDGRRYYISMRDTDADEWGLYVYDTRLGLWLREDATRAGGFARLGGALYMASAADRALYELGAADAEETFEWSATLAPFDDASHAHKGLTRLRLRIDMSPGAWFCVELMQDRGPWQRVWTQAATRAMTVNIPLRVGRCDRFAVRLSGRGRTEVRSMVREYVVESEA